MSELNNPLLPAANYLKKNYCHIKKNAGTYKRQLFNSFHKCLSLPTLHGAL